MWTNQWRDSPPCTLILVRNAIFRAGVPNKFNIFDGVAMQETAYLNELAAGCFLGSFPQFTKPVCPF